MTVKEAMNLFQCHQRSNVRQRTINSYAYPLQRVRAQYGERPLESFTPDELFTFLENLNRNHARSTRRLVSSRSWTPWGQENASARPTKIW